MSNLDLNLFKPFIAVYEHKNIARAAEKLFVTASAVSMRVKELSNQLGVVLFVPHARGVHPTKEADELYKKILPAIAAITSSSESLGEFTAESECTIHLGAAVNISRFVLLDFVCEFMKKFPKARISIHNKSKAELLDMLYKRDIDVLVYRQPLVSDKDYISVERLCDLPKAFFASHDFMRKYGIGTTVTQEELAKLPVAVPDKMRDDAQFFVLALNKSLSTFIDTQGLGDGNELAYAFTKKGMSLGYFNEHCVDPRDDISKITVEGLSLPMHALAVAYYKDESSKAILAFLDELKKAVQ